MTLETQVGNSSRGPTILLASEDGLMLNWETTPEELERLADELRHQKAVYQDGIASELLTAMARRDA